MRAYRACGCRPRGGAHAKGWHAPKQIASTCVRTCGSLSLVYICLPNPDRSPSLSSFFPTRPHHTHWEAAAFSLTVPSTSCRSTNNACRTCWLVGVDPRRRQEKVNSWQASLLGGPTAVGAATTIYRAQLPCKLRHYSHKAVCNSYCASKDPYILQRCSLPILYARWIKPA